MAIFGSIAKWEKKPSDDLNRSRAIILCTLIAAAVWPGETWAADTLGNVVCNISDNVVPIAPLINALSYIGGAIVGVKGVYLLKKHYDNPNDSQIVKGIAHLLGAGALAALPKAIATMQNSLHLGGAGGGGLKACSAGAVTSGATGLDVIMQNFVNNIHQPMFSLMSVLCFVVGVYLVARGLLKASKVGSDPRAAATHSILVNLAVGAVLMSIGSMLGTMLQSVLGDSAMHNMKSFAGIDWSKVTSGETTAADNTVKAVLAFVQIVGGISFVRGWLMIRNAVEGTGQVTIPQGLTHVIGGTMAINIDSMLSIIDKTFGTGIIKA